MDTLWCASEGCFGDPPDCGFLPTAACLATSCTNGVMLDPGSCDAFGGCVHPSHACPTGLCNATSTSCAAFDGASCSEDGECLSSHCVEASCCAVACSACQACGAGLDSCENLPQGSLSTSCPTMQPCNGQGACAGALQWEIQTGYVDDIDNQQFGCAARPRNYFGFNRQGQVARVREDAHIDYGCLNVPPAGVPGSLTVTLPSGSTLTTATAPSVPTATVEGLGVDGLGNTLLALRTSEAVLSFGPAGNVAANTAGSADLVIVKLSPSGTILWSHVFGDDVAGPAPFSVRLSVAEDGAVVLAGKIERDVDFGGGVLTGADPDVYIAKLDADGALIFARRISAAQTQDVEAVTILGTGVIAIAGQLDGTLDLGAGPLVGPGAFYARLDGSIGVALASGLLPSAAFPYRAAFDDSGNMLVIVNGAPTKLDANAQPLWSKTFAFGYVDMDAAMSPNGLVAIARCNIGTVDLGGGATTDGCLAGMFDEGGNFLYSRLILQNPQPGGDLAVGAMMDRSVIVTAARYLPPAFGEARIALFAY